MALYITLADIKRHLRIDGDDEDALLTDYIEAAQGQAETYMRRPIYSSNPAEDPVTTDAANIPVCLKQFLRVTVGDYYRNRENQQDKAYSTYYPHLLDGLIKYD